MLAGVKALSLTLVLGIALLSSCGWLTATGWDTLGWGILLIGSIAPVSGCILAWAVYGLP